MWFEILPSYAVVGIALFMPQISIYLTNLLFTGNPYKRILNNRDDKYHMLRDARLSGVSDYYKQIGLESLGDD